MRQAVTLGVTTMFALRSALRGVLLFSVSVPALALEYFEGTVPVMWDVRGEIREGDFRTFLNVVADHGLPEQVTLESPGGNVAEAMKFGELFRAAHVSVVVESRCASACFLMAVGGTQRLFFEPVGLHRPRVSGSHFGDLSQGQARELYAELTDAISDYLRRMDVPQRAIDRMMRTPSHEIEWVEPGHLALSTDAHSVSEWLTSRCGALSFEQQQHYGLILAAKLAESMGDAIGLDPREVERLEQKVADMPADYVAALEEVSECRQATIDRQREGILEAVRSGELIERLLDGGHSER